MSLSIPGQLSNEAEHAVAIRNGFNALTRSSTGDLASSQPPITKLWRWLQKGIAAQPPLVTALCACLGGGFILRPTPVWALVFYLGVLPLTIFELWRRRGFAWRNAGTVLAGAMILWSVLTLIWGEDPGGHRTVKFLWESICTSFFFIALLLAFEIAGDQVRRRFGTALIVAGAINAVFSITHWLWIGPTSRLVGWAETRHEILGASVIGVAYLFALGRSLRERPHRAFNGFAALLCFAFIVFTQSRTPLAATIVATSVLMSAVRGSLRAYGAVALAAMVLALAALLLIGPEQLHGYVTAALARGDSHRLEIWSRTLAEIAQRPWLGHGLAANLTGMEFTFPHNLYLSMLFYNGIIGFVLLVAVVAVLLGGLIRHRGIADRNVLIALWVNVLIAGLTDLGQVTSGPGPNWYVIWLPIALSIGAIASAEKSPATFGGSSAGPRPLPK